ncbi:oligosaccharide flippase family protein (plasmid) [Lactiplantibacillus plantarum]|uniref:flippase n=1 Tax=Lactiplantibacillus plantarum TaxID=1590 RepID=UPI0012FAA317|nr:flippase [Lactiplantibacillus plantarum]QGX67503.1 oligosaccharide flippase family protein [Lactiplantibacillus plantarum]
MTNKSLKLNAFLNTLRNVLNMVFPLITFPYVSRILGANGLGIYSFSNSIISYFLLLSGLGISTYAIREGAKYRENKENISFFASQIFSINIFSMIFSYSLLFLSLILFPKLHLYSVCILIFSLQIFFTTIGTEWIYTIFEDYTYITIRSILFNILSIFMLFLFVKGKNDYLIYAAITVLASAGSNILNFFHAKTFCNIRFTFNYDFWKHIKPIIIIFASNLAILIFVNSDVTILGIMKSTYTIGIYTVAVKIYSVLKTVLSAALIVTVPRLAALYGEKKKNQYEKTASDIFNFLIFSTFPAMTGLFMISSNVIIILSGKSFLPADVSLKLLSIALIFSISGWFYSECVLIPAKLEKIVLISTTISAVVNIVLNIVLIPFYSENAAAFSTVIAEAINMIIMVTYGKNIVKIKGIKRNLIAVIIGSIGICLVCLLIDTLRFGIMFETCLSIVCSAIVYAVILILMKNKVMLEQLKLIKARL